MSSIATVTARQDIRTAFLDPCTFAKRYPNGTKRMMLRAIDPPRDQYPLKNSRKDQNGIILTVCNSAGVRDSIVMYRMHKRYKNGHMYNFLLLTSEFLPCSVSIAVLVEIFHHAFTVAPSSTLPSLGTVTDVEIVAFNPI